QSQGLQPQIDLRIQQAARMDQQDFHTCDSPCCAAYPPPADWRCSPIPAGFDRETCGPAHGLAEAKDGKKESQSTTQPQGLMIKSRPTEHPQHSAIQAPRRSRTEEQIEKRRLVKTLDHSKKWGNPTVESSRIGTKNTGAEVLATKGADN